MCLPSADARTHQTVIVILQFEIRAVFLAPIYRAGIAVAVALRLAVEPFQPVIH
jgi:hypothetical protein